MEKSWWCLSINTIQIRLSFCPARSIWNNAACIALCSVCVFPPSPAAKDTAWPLGIPQEVRQLPLGRGSWKLFWSTTILQGVFFARCVWWQCFIVPCKRCKMMVSFRRGLVVSPHKRCWGLVNVQVGMIPNFDETFCFGWALNGWTPITFEQTKTSEFLTQLTGDSRMKLPQFKGRWFIDPVKTMILLSKFGPTRLTWLLHQASHNHVGHLVCFQRCCYKIRST